MAKLWVFGDSFSAYNENWVKTLSEKSNLEIVNISYSGSSLFYTYKSILDNVYKFNSEDSVIVGLTDHARHFFNGYHFIFRQYEKEKADRIQFLTKIDNPKLYNELISSFTKFADYLYNDEEEQLRALSMIESVVNIMPQRLKVKNFIPYFTINGEYFFGKYKHLNFDFSKYPPFWRAFADFVQKQYGYEPDDIVGIRDFLRTPNHWIDHPEWEDTFWKIYGELFKPIWNG